MSLAKTLRFITRHPLNRGNGLGAVARFLKWQVGSRLVPGPVIFDWVGGAKFVVRRGETGLTGNLYTGLHELPEMGFVLHSLRPEDLFIDVGANVGSFTLLACAAVGARGVAFEPVPDTFRRLNENLRVNHLEGRVRGLNQGVGAQPGVLAFAGDGDTTSHALASGEHSDHAIDVEVTTLDAALAGESPTMMKIDVEGFETAVLDGAPQTLANPSLRAVVMELAGSGARYGYDESKIVDRMLGLGFKTYAYNPLERKLTPLGGKNPHSDNTLFLRDVATVEERVRTAPKVSVNGRQF